MYKVTYIIDDALMDEPVNIPIAFIENEKTAEALCLKWAEYIFLARMFIHSVQEELDWDAVDVIYANLVKNIIENCFNREAKPEYLELDVFFFEGDFEIREVDSHEVLH